MKRFLIFCLDKTFPNGTVTMEIQGASDAIDQVIMAIERGRFIRIANMDSKIIPTDPDERSFREEWD